MNRIKIGGIEKPLNEVSESWISQQIQNRKHDGQDVCVQVFIHAEGVDLLLSTPECVGSGGAGRMPNDEESALIQKWNDSHLNRQQWSIGNLISFLKQTKLLR